MHFDLESGFIYRKRYTRACFAREGPSRGAAVEEIWSRLLSQSSSSPQSSVFDPALFSLSLSLVSRSPENDSFARSLAYTNISWTEGQGGGEGGAGGVKGQKSRWQENKSNEMAWLRVHFPWARRWTRWTTRTRAFARSRENAKTLDGVASVVKSGGDPFKSSVVQLVVGRARPRRSRRMTLHCTRFFSLFSAGFDKLCKHARADAGPRSELIASRIIN